MRNVRGQRRTHIIQLDECKRSCCAVGYHARKESQRSRSSQHIVHIIPIIPPLFLSPAPLSDSQTFTTLPSAVSECDGREELDHSSPVFSPPSHNIVPFHHRRRVLYLASSLFAAAFFHLTINFCSEITEAIGIWLMQYTSL